MPNLSTGLQNVVASLLLLLGAMLAIYGWLFPEAHSSVAVRVNVNLIWGSVMSVFALAMFGLARRS